MNITAKQPMVSTEVSMFRLYLMRVLYLLNFVLVGFGAWAEIIKHQGDWDSLRGVAFSFWAALAVLSGLGLRYPLKMLPLLFIQLFYKSVWLIAVAPFLWSADRSIGFIKGMLIGVLLDLIIIPWPYVLSTYVKNRGDRWS